MLVKRHIDAAGRSIVGVLWPYSQFGALDRLGGENEKNKKSFRHHRTNDVKN